MPTAASSAVLIKFVSENVPSFDKSTYIYDVSSPSNALCIIDIVPSPRKAIKLTIGSNKVPPKDAVSAFTGLLITNSNKMIIAIIKATFVRALLKSNIFFIFIFLSQVNIV